MKFVISLSLAFSAFFFFTIQTDACLWIAGSPQVGERLKIDGLTADEFLKQFVSHKDRNYWEKVKIDIEKDSKFYSTPDFQNNSAVALIHLGDIDNAIKLLEKRETEKPGAYFTATNLGTAYELKGENQKALNWIKEGVKRNKDSHYGTEWLHIKILEAKLAIEKDSDWLKNNSVLGADFSDLNADKVSVTDQNGQKKLIVEIEEALIYQLHERLEFVKPPEPIVADLLFDLSKIFSVTRSPEHAKAVKELSVQYGANPESTSKNNESERVSGREKKYFYPIIAVIMACLLITGIYFFMRKRKRIAN